MKRLSILLLSIFSITASYADKVNLKLLYRQLDAVAGYAVLADKIILRVVAYRQRIKPPSRKTAPCRVHVVDAVAGRHESHAEPFAGAGADERRDAGMRVDDVEPALLYQLLHAEIGPDSPVRALGIEREPDMLHAGAFKRGDVVPSVRHDRDAVAAADELLRELNDMRLSAADAERHGCHQNVHLK